MNQISTIHIASDIGIKQHISLPEGMTVLEIARCTHNSVFGLKAYVKSSEVYTQEWVELEFYMWGRVKPKIDDCIMFGYTLHDGDILSDVFSIATAIVTIATTIVFGPQIGALVGGFLSVVGFLLFPPEQADSSTAASPTERARRLANVDSDSNILAKNGYLPIIAGIRRISPPEIASPLFTLENGTQTLQRIFALEAQNTITAMQVDRAPISDFPAITTEIRDGAETAPITTFIDKVSNFTSISEQLTTFSLDGVDLIDQVTPSNSEPLAIRFTTIFDALMDEISIRLRVDSFIKSDSATQDIRVPIRIRFRVKGSLGSWFNIPEIHLLGRDVSPFLKEIRLRWDSDFGVSDTPSEITYEFFQKVPAAAFTLSDGTTGDQWQAETHFVSGTGLTDTQNISGKRNGLRITLDETLYPKQEYEWEIVRGLAVNSVDLTASTYVLGGAVNSLFVSKNVSAKWQVPTDQGAFIGRLTVAHATTIINRAPCQKPKTSLIALKSTGQTVKNVTALIARNVYDWDGSGWNTLTTTKNPATHYYRILYDYLVYNKIDTSLIVNSDFVSWRQECIDRGYEVSAVYAGAPISQVLDSIATAGFARRRNGINFGVDWFRDRSAENPLLTFSPRNSKISLQWVQDEKPVGIRASFQDESDDYRDAELQINNAEYTNFAGYISQTYDMIANASLIRRRATFDLLQRQYQTRRIWNIETSIQGLVCDRGDLIGAVTDLLNDTNSGARIRKVINSTTFTIDQIIPAESTDNLFGISNIFDPTNIFNVGAQSVCLVTTPTGTEMRTITAALQDSDGNVIRVDLPFSSADLVGAHITIGPANDFMSRVVVSEVKRKNEERAQLICVDEAPEIFDKLQQEFG